MKRHALITAGTKGIGRAVSECFLEKGYTLTINYRTEDEAFRAFQKKWADSEKQIQYIQGDLTHSSDIIALVEAAKERFGRIDCCINNAGPYIFERKKLVDYPEEEWENLLAGNLTAVYRLAKLIIPIMRAQQFGRWITYGFQEVDRSPGWIDRGPFAAAKTGLVSLTRTLALEEAEHGITSNMVCPGVIEGDMKTATISEALDKNQSKTPMGRSATGEDIARMISFLCEDASSMVTGSVIDVTGGVDTVHQFRYKNR